MILTLFVQGEGDFIDPDAWELLIDPEHKPLEPGATVPVYVGLDLATKPGGDDAAVVGVYPEDGLVKLAWHKVWKGGQQRRSRLRLSETVQPYLERQAQQYRIAAIYFDPYQALKLADDLEAAGLRRIEVPQTHASRGPKDTALYDLAVNGQLVLYDAPEIRKATTSASAKELGNGLLFIQKAGRGRIDLLIALSNCASEAANPMPAPAGAVIDFGAGAYQPSERASTWGQRTGRAWGRPGERTLANWRTWRR